MSTLAKTDSKTNVNRVTKTIVTSPDIYKPVGPYSQAILANKTLYVSGMLGMDPQGQLVCGGAETQTRQALNNLEHVLVAGGASFDQAILADKTLYVSGVLGMDPEAQLVPGGAEAQAKQALDNLKHVLEAGGASLESVIKTTILLANMEDFPAVNKIYAEYFTKDQPARATFQVAKLPKDAAVEIEAIALSGDLVVAVAGPCPCTRT
ncbi:unnamed protein product [Arctia plantaginis]|uniref:Uncharacterized protein n=1 Tax=Arctia plantaginis TaxID=874455 RepID=A0A8S1BS95_ARCPL|nr:unnamed protein product [Arctia plantaginis]CAB3259902.1 unnamed protein product [Arctia plantaginis]